MVLSPPRWELQSKLPSSSLFQRELVPRSIEVDFPLQVQNQSIVSLAFSLLPSPQFMPLSPYHGLIAPPHPSMTEYRLLPPLPPPPVTPRHIEVDDDLILFLPPPPLLEHTFSLQSILSSLLSTVQPLPLSISFLLPTASFNYAVHTTPPPTPSHESYLLSEPFASLDFLYPLPPLHSSPFFLQLVQTLFLLQHTPLPPDLPSLHSATSAQRALLTHYTSFLHCQAYLPLPIVLVATLLTHRRASCASPTSPSTPNSRPCCRPLHPFLFFPSR